MKAERTVKMLGISYMRDGAIFECLSEIYFPVLLKCIGEAASTEDAISEAFKLEREGKPICRVYKICEVLEQS